MQNGNFILTLRTIKSLYLMLCRIKIMHINTMNIFNTLNRKLKYHSKQFSFKVNITGGKIIKLFE